MRGRSGVDHQAIQAHFDRIAQLSSEGWNHNSHYHGFLLRQLPPRCEQALDIGCGTGAFSRLLAERADRVLALDLSPRMIEVARERSRQYESIEYQVADAMTWEFPAERFDCVVSLATLHHLPLREMLSKMKATLKPGGTLVVLDLFEPQGLSDGFTSAMAMPVNVALRLVKTGRLREPREVREAWAEHGRHESYVPLSQVRGACEALLPGARVRKHLLWRYSIIWRK